MDFEQDFIYYVASGPIFGTQLRVLLGHGFGTALQGGLESIFMAGYSRIWDMKYRIM